jgi:two-component system, NarL family, nitrate/nitrite response regulator NarL
MNPLCILIVDDQHLFRAGVKSLIESNKELKVIGEAGDGLEAIELARQSIPDVILMDIAMPRCSGLEATRVIKKELPTIKIIILTVSDYDEDLFEAIKNGASGYLLKDIHPRQFLDLLLGLRQGEAPISGIMAAKILAEFRENLQKEEPSKSSPAAANPYLAQMTLPMDEIISPLSGREIQVLERLVDGKSNREIADELFVTEDTVKIHMRNIMEKLHLKNRVQVAMYAMKKGMAGKG